MSYPKKKQAQKANKASLLALQQRENMKGILLSKFLEKYGKNDKKLAELISKELETFLKREKLTEAALKEFEEKIKNLPKTLEKPPLSTSQSPAKADEKAEAKQEAKEPPKEQGKEEPHEKKKEEDAASDTSSKAPKSLYQFATEEDEWATILKFDHELYKRENDLKAQRIVDQKKKIKVELDKQILEKKKILEEDLKEETQYNGLVHEQLKKYDEKEKIKEKDKKEKLMQEKFSRDKQLEAENIRKKVDKKKEKEIDAILVTKIKEEITNEQNEITRRKLDENEHYKHVLLENEEQKKRNAEQAIVDKEADMKAQEEFSKVLARQEKQKQDELGKRENKIKQFMAMMNDTVVRDQQAQIIEEENKILKYTRNKEERDRLEDENRKKRQNEQKKEIKKFLDLQVNERNERKKIDEAISIKQAEFWKKDTEEFNQNERSKMENQKEINKKYAEILKLQMQEKHDSKKGKMNQQELLQNKKILKEIALKSQQQFKRDLVYKK